MKYYLIDASAFIYAIENLDKIKKNFFIERANKEAFLYISQFCVPEVLNGFARIFYRDKKIGDQLYKKWKNEFIKAIHNRNILYCYDLHRYHNLNTAPIYHFEHTIPYKKGEGSLSAFDILLIAMGMELKKIHSSNNVSLLTRDGRLHRIANSSRSFVTAEWFE